MFTVFFRYNTEFNINDHEQIIVSITILPMMMMMMMTMTMMTLTIVEDGNAGYELYIIIMMNRQQINNNS